MTVTILQLQQFLDSALQPQRWRDYCPNGLQIAGTRNIQKIVTGVTACQALLDAAVSERADAILVHHGYFWRGEDACIVGIKRQRIATLLQHGVHLLAYHLPLDGHATLGNNVQLARHLDFVITGEFADQEGRGLGLTGELSTPMSGQELAAHLNKRLSRMPLYIAGESAKIKRLAWCTGAAQDFISEAIALGVDSYLTGEVSERTVHIARESSIHFYAAGHHATERYGVQALGDHIAEQLNIQHQFIDIDNPV